MRWVLLRFATRLNLAGAPAQRAVYNVGNTKTAQSLCFRHHSVRADQLHRGRRGKLSAVGKRPLCAELDALMADLMGDDAAGGAVRSSGDAVSFTRAHPRRVSLTNLGKHRNRNLYLTT